MVSRNRRSGPMVIGIALVLAIAVAMSLLGCAGPAKPSASIQLRLETDSIKSGSTTTLRLTATNDGDVPVDGTLEVVAFKGQQYVTISTGELSQLTLPAKGSSVIRIYTLAGNADLQVVPVIQATIKNKDGTIAGQQQQMITITP
jgi:hypothetical protein